LDTTQDQQAERRASIDGHLVHSTSASRAAEMHLASIDGHLVSIAGHLVSLDTEVDAVVAQRKRLHTQSARRQARQGRNRPRVT